MQQYSAGTFHGLASLRMTSQEAEGLLSEIGLAAVSRSTIHRLPQAVAAANAKGFGARALQLLDVEVLEAVGEAFESL